MLPPVVVMQPAGDGQPGEDDAAEQGEQAVDGVHAEAGVQGVELVDKASLDGHLV